MKTTTLPREVTASTAQRLYVILCGDGWTCLGFDVCERRIAALAAEGIPAPSIPATIGTPERYQQYKTMVAAARARHEKTGWRSSSELTPELVGLEGRRVEVTHQWESGERETVRFQVGKSTGWIPCHIQLANSRSHGGPSVTLGKILSVRVIR